MIPSRWLWAAAAALAASNLALALLFPSLHGEGEPTPSLVAAQCLMQGRDGFGALLSCLREAAHNYGWSYYALSTLFAAVLGETPTAGLVLTAACFAALLVGTVRLGEHLGGARTGAWAAALLLAYPIVPYYGRRLQFEAFQAALCAWFLVAVLRSDGLRKPRAVIACAALLLVGAWCKPPTALFMLPAAATAWLLTPGSRRQRGIGLLGLAATGLAVLPVLGWYRLVEGLWAPAANVAETLVHSRLVFPRWGVDEAPWRYHLYFLRMFVNYQAGAGLAALALASLGWAVWRRRRVELVVWSAYVGGALVHSAFAYKKFYYTMPGLSAVAAGSAAFLAARDRRLRWAVGAVCLLSVLRWQVGTYGPDDLLPEPLRPVLAFNEPRAFAPEPTRRFSSLAPDLPVLLALAEADGTLQLLTLPRGGKVAGITRRPELYGFEHQLAYDLGRRGVPVGYRYPQLGGAVQGSRVVYLYPPVGWSKLDLGGESILSGCVELAMDSNRDLTERLQDVDCGQLEAQVSGLLGRLEILHVDRFAPRRLRALARIRDDVEDLPPPIAARATVYAEDMGVLAQLPERVRAQAALATPAQWAHARRVPLRYRRRGRAQGVYPR